MNEFKMVVRSLSFKMKFSFVSNILRDHMETLHSQLDPVEDVENPRQLKQPNYKFAVPIVIMLLSVFDGTVWLPYESDPANFDLATLKLNPFVFTHQCMPDSVWLMFDFLTSFTTLAMSLIYASIIFMRNVDSKFVFYKNRVNGKFSIGNAYMPLESSVSDQISRFHSRSVGVLKLSLFVCLFVLFLFYYVMVLINSRFHETLVHSVIYWFVGFFLFISYLVYAVFVPTAYILIASRFMQIRQKYVLSKFKVLIEQINKVKKSSKHLSQLWMRYKSLNREQISICKQISEYSRFGVARLSIMIPFFIITICYQLYLDIVVPASLSQMYIFLFLLMECNMFLLVMISECARVDKNNRRFMRFNQHYCIKHFERAKTGKVHMLVLKAQTLQTINRLRPYSFYVLGTYRITNKSYNLIITYISINFMYLFQNQLLNHY